MLSPYTPARARAMARGLTSVAKILSAGRTGRPLRNSLRAIARL